MYIFLETSRTVARSIVVQAKLTFIHNEKKALRETQTLRAGCSNGERKFFSPPQTPSRGRRTAKM